jgi:hypothetical protein
MDRLLDAEERATLLPDVAGDRTLALLNRLEQLLPRCHATTEQIVRLIGELPVSGVQDQLFETLLDHPAMPEALLFELLEQERFITALGHRRGPQLLLEHLVKRFAYPEAIATLALHYYGRDDHPIESFVAFVRRHRHCAMLDHCIRSGELLSQERRRAGLQALDSDG